MGRGITLLVNGKGQILQYISLCGTGRLIRIITQPIHSFSHPQSRMIIVLVQIRLSAHFEAIICRHLRTKLNVKKD